MALEVGGVVRIFVVRKFEHVQFVINTLADEFSPVEQAEATELLHTSNYQDVFSKSEYDLGCVIIEHRIDKGDARQIKQGLRRQLQTSLPIIDTFTENM